MALDNSLLLSLITARNGQQGAIEPMLDRIQDRAIAQQLADRIDRCGAMLEALVVAYNANVGEDGTPVAAAGAVYEAAADKPFTKIA